LDFPHRVYKRLLTVQKVKKFQNFQRTPWVRLTNRMLHL
jgi:hypothetical protein